MADAVNTDDFYGSDGGNATSGPQTFQTLDDFYGPPAAPQSGGAMDTIWNSTTTALGKVDNALGGWADKVIDKDTLGLDQSTEKWMRDNGVYNDYENGHVNFLRSVNEAVMRPAIIAGQLAYRSVTGVIGGAILGLGELSSGQARLIAGDGSSTIRNLLATPSGAVGEYLTAIGEGSYPAPELMTGGESPNATLREGVSRAEAEAAAENAQVTSAQSARAAGVVGEGEAGFYGAHEITPENLAARQSAAQEAAVEMPEPLPPAPDIPALARRIDPETFDQFDRLELQRSAERDTLARLEQERQASPEVTAARSAVHDILGTQADEPLDVAMGRETAFRASAPEPEVAKLDAALARLDKAVEDTPEMVAARDRLQQADFAMRDLAVPLSDAYRQAHDMAPNLPLTAEQAAEEATEPAERARGAATAIGASKEGQAATAAPNVVGEPLGAGLSLETEGRRIGAPGAPIGEDAAPVAESAAVADQAEAPAATEPTGELKPIEGTGEQLPRRVAQRTEENAIASGLTDVQGDVPTYGALKDKDQARIVVETMDKDYERAIRIAQGKEAPPAGATPEAFLIGVEKRAIAAGDFETFNRLRETNLAEAGTTMGQRISTYRTRMESSPLEAIQEVQQARQAASTVDIPTATRQVADEVKAEVAAEVRKAPIKVDKLTAFLKTLECD